MIVVITSGFYNPIHRGHISCINEASKLGHMLIVLVNNDKQVELKGSQPFMDEEHRKYIVQNIKGVNLALISASKTIDVCSDLKSIRQMFPYDTLIFAKGGDRTIDNIPEVETCLSNNILMMFNIGESKKISSSEILKRSKK